MKTTTCWFCGKEVVQRFRDLSYCDRDCLSAHYSVARLLYAKHFRKYAKIVSFDLTRVDRVR